MEERTEGRKRGETGSGSVCRQAEDPRCLSKVKVCIGEPRAMVKATVAEASD